MDKELLFLFPLRCRHLELVLDMMVMHLALITPGKCCLLLEEFRLKRNMLINVLLSWLSLIDIDGYLWPPTYSSGSKQLSILENF